MFKGETFNICFCFESNLNTFHESNFYHLACLFLTNKWDMFLQCQTSSKNKCFTFYVRGISQKLNRVNTKINWRKNDKAAGQPWRVWPAEVAEATPTAPASMTSPDEDVVRPSCCREEPGISSAGKQQWHFLDLPVCLFVCLGGLHYFVFYCIFTNNFLLKFAMWVYIKHPTNKARKLVGPLDFLSTPSAFLKGALMKYSLWLPSATARTVPLRTWTVTVAGWAEAGWQV